jgi:predicted nucleic acid binding AN1-type Zn finger protein
LDCKRKVPLIIGHCKYCDGEYCSVHRLPEDHNCSHMGTCKKTHYDKNLIKLMSEKI